MRVLLTGSDGYLGCLLAPEIVRDGHTVQSSYRVSSAKISSELPGFSGDWDADRGAQQLAEVFGQVALDEATFTGRGHTRLRQLGHLPKTSQLDGHLFWTHP